MDLNSIAFVVDPLHKYLMTKDHVEAACGLLPHFMEGPSESIAENMNINYAYSNGWNKDTKAQVDSDGVFTYKGDDPLYPLMSAHYGEETVYIYPYAIVAVITEGQPMKWTRMD